jgi:putative ABC transport system permease protein
MLRGSLSWSSAAKIAWRDMRHSVGKFVFVLFSVAIGVAAITGVRSFSQAFRQALLLNARSIMAADLNARMMDPASQSELDAIGKLRQQGITTTIVNETLSMAATPQNTNPILISLKAVDPAAYPFYGKVQLQPDETLQAALSDDSVAVGADLLLRLHTDVGGQVLIGGHQFCIAAVIRSEPDQLSSSFAMGPRVLMSEHALEQTTLLQPGSRRLERILFYLPPSLRDHVQSVKQQLIAILPEAQVTDFEETSPALSQGLDRSTSMLSLLSLVAMVLGALGVATAMHGHMEQRLDTIAIMKSLGARSSHVMRIFLLQTLTLEVLGSMLGIAGGLMVQAVLPKLMARYVPLQPQLILQWRAVVLSVAVGLMTTLLFTLPPLLRVRGIRPGLILRRNVDTAAESTGKSKSPAVNHFRAHWPQYLAVVLILAGLASIASLFSESATVGTWFAAGLATLLVVMLGLSKLVLVTARAVLEKTRLHLPSVVRQGLANLYRPGNQTATILAVLGAGVMLITTVFLVEQTVVKEMKLTSSPNQPNVFLVDISPQELDGVKHLLQQQSAVKGDVETVPTVGGRITAINGVPAAQLKLENFPKRMLQSVQLTWSDSLPTGSRVSTGAWWQPDVTTPQVAVDSGAAGRLHIQTGSTITFSVEGQEFTATVAALVKSNGQHAFSRAAFILPHAVLAAYPTIWYGAVHVDVNHVDDVQRALYAAYPTVTIINVADVLETVRGVVRQIAIVVEFLAGFSIFAGCVILAASIAGTRYRRIREVVVLKALGATRKRIVAVFSIEFLALGLVAGGAGVLFANLLSSILLIKMEADHPMRWVVSIVAVLATALLADATGWAASHRILGQRPLEILREE